MYIHQAVYILDNLFPGEREIPNYEEAWTRYCNKASCYCHRRGEESLEKYSKRRHHSVKKHCTCFGKRCFS